MGAFLLAAAAFVVMEPVSYLSHRFVMHRFGMAWHRSHHVPTEGPFEANDLFPVCFSVVTMMAMTAAVTLPSLRPLLWVGIGSTAYGAAYLFVHEVYIHARAGRLPRLRGLEHLKEAHRVHHLFGGEPYGMLVPVVPRALRERARRSDRDVLEELRAGPVAARAGRAGRASRAATASFS
ncbi:MAG TPA: sterol desaturase family protein, partial [Acidimicrobiales bacterium]|nr:sterol desaturase family protein [Acidimicrobiales bacterium]